MQPHQKKSITMALKIQDVSKEDDPSDLQSALDDLSERDGGSRGIEGIPDPDRQLLVDLRS